MYVISTTNLKLLVCLKRYNCDFLMTPQNINRERYKNEAVAITSNRGLAMLALVDGAKVYETVTMSSLIPDDCSNEELLDKIIDEFLEVLGIRKNFNGYEYLKYIITCNVKDDEYCLKAMSKEVYPECAKAFGVSPVTVARTTNDLIKKSYGRKPEMYSALYAKDHPDKINAAPKANNFVVVMANKIRALMPNI